MPAKENLQNFFGKVDRTFKRQSEEEYRVHQITNPKVSWGPTPDEMDDIVKYCDTHSTRTKALGAIWDILSGGNSKAWKQVYKTLLLVEHLLLNASPETVREIQQRLNILKSLEDFTFKDSDGVDRGINVRKRAETVRELAMSDDIDERRRVTAETRARFMDVVRNDATGLGSNFSVKQKMMLSTSSESVTMNRPNTSAFTPQPGSVPPLPQSSYSMPQGQVQAPAPAPQQQPMGMGMNFQQPAGFGMGQQRAQQFQVVQGNTMGMRLINQPQAQPQTQMQPQGGQVPMAAPMQQYGTPSATPQAQEVPVPVLPQIQLLTPEQMMSMPPEQLQAYQQQLLLQKQQMAEMLARAQISQPAVPAPQVQAQQAMPVPTAPVPIAQPQVPLTTPITQPSSQLQPNSNQVSVPTQPAQPAQQNFSNLLSFF